MPKSPSDGLSVRLDGEEQQLNPRVAAMIALVLKAAKDIKHERQGWIELHWDGPKVHGRLKKHVGIFFNTT